MFRIQAQMIPFSCAFTLEIFWPCVSFRMRISRSVHCVILSYVSESLEVISVKSIALVILNSFRISDHLISNLISMKIL